MASGWWGSGGYLVSDLIKEARCLIDDDHDEEDGFIKSARWLTWLNWEMVTLARWSVQKSYVRPPITNTNFTGPTGTITGVLRLVGVLNDEGAPLKNAQADGIAEPVWPQDNDGPASYYTAHGAGNDLTVSLNPEDAGTYTARYIPLPTYVAAVTDTVPIPMGFEKRLVLGMASWAQVKDNARSSLLETKLRLADEEIALAYAGRGEEAAPRVISRRRTYVPWWLKRTV